MKAINPFIYIIISRCIKIAEVDKIVFLIENRITIYTHYFFYWIINIIVNIK